MEADELRLRAMGTEVHVVAVGAAPEVLAAARARIEDLERRWSRFLPDSEVSKLNASAGRPVVVSPDTLELVQRSAEAWIRTDGAFDPTLLPEIVALGYDASFETIRRRPAGGAGDGPAGNPRPVPHRRVAGIMLDAAVGAATLPPGAGLDPGGIGKGLAADIVVREALAGGTAGICVNIGGDLVAGGAAPLPEGWVVDVADPWDGSSRARVVIDRGAVATTSRTRRTWRRGGATWHHLLDPRTSLPARSGLASATVVAGAGWWAEAVAKAVFLAGPTGAGAVADRLGAGAVLIDDAGSLHLVGEIAVAAA